MQHWLVKSEPDTWSWDDHWSSPKRTAEWDGVRNHQAANNMRAMEKGDLAFFYHSGKSREIVGIVKVTKTFYPDHTDETGKFGMVDFKAVEPLEHPVSLAKIKSEPKLGDMVLVRNSRLSVMPVGDEQWQIILDLASQEAE